MAKYFLGSVGTAEAFKYDHTKDQYEIAFVSKTLTDSTLNISTTKDDIRGGTGAPIQFSFYHDPNVEITLTDIAFNEKYIEAQLGTQFDIGGEAYISESYVATGEALTHTLSKTLANFGGGCDKTPAKGVWYSIDGGDWKMATTEIDGQVFTAPKAGKVCLRYIGVDDTAEIAKITSEIIPQELFLVITAPIYSGDACSASNGKKAGTITYEVPRFKLNGAQEFTMNMSQNQTMSLSGVALAAEDGCDINGSTLLRIIKVIDGYDPYADAKAIYIDLDNIDPEDIPVIKIVYANNTVGTADNAKFNFTVGAGEAQAGVATKKWKDYTGSTAGTYIVTVSGKDNTDLVDSVSIEITE